MDPFIYIIILWTIYINSVELFMPLYIGKYNKKQLHQQNIEALSGAKDKLLP